MGSGGYRSWYTCFSNLVAGTTHSLLPSLSDLSIPALVICCMLEWERIIGLCFQFYSLAAGDSTQPPNLPGRNHTASGHSPTAAGAHSQDKRPSTRHRTCLGYPGTQTMLPHHVEVLSAGHWRAWGEDVGVVGAVGPLSDKNQPVYPLCKAVWNLVVVESSFITVKQKDYFAIYLFIY